MSPSENVFGAIQSTRWKLVLPGRAAATLAIALGLFVVATIALAVNLTLQRESFGWVEHANEVLRTVSALERRILEAESGERGYLLTGENHYLDSYNRSQAEVPKLLEASRQLVSDNLIQVQRLDELRPIVEARLAEFKQVVELGPAHSNDALEILRTARSRQLTALIEEKLGQFRQAEVRDFVARGETERRIESIKKLVEEAIALALIAAKDQSVRMNLQHDPSIDLVLVDKVQIQQVLLNLLRNAIEAMQTSERRELNVSTNPAENKMVAVKVVDTGSGISPDIAAQLFKPFVTTKRQGMGVGLSISRTIIESHGGQITVTPNPGGGTIFCFTLRGVVPEELADDQ